MIAPAVSASVLRLGERARTRRFNALATLPLGLALVPALAGGGPPALLFALVLTPLLAGRWISTTARGPASVRWRR